MKRLVYIFFLIVFTYLNVSCFCKGPQLSQTLIDSSAVVFEGKIIEVDTIDIDGYDVDITFKVFKLFKGKPVKMVVVRSTRSSCGFYFQNKELRESIGKKYLMYCCLGNGSYVYHYCGDRRVLFPLKKYFMNEYTQRSESLLKYNIRKYDYERELFKLDSLTTKK